MGQFSFGFFALLVTEFLGAFNDNIFKMVISLIIVDFCLHQPNGSLILSLSGVIFVLPFLLFSTHAGFLADRFSKKHITIAVKCAEVLIMIAAFFVLKTGHVPAMLGLLFLMGTHSAFFSPAKYGILPELLKDQKLSEGNGLITMSTYAAIILGQAVGGYLIIVFSHSIWQSAYVFIGIAVTGLFSSFWITPVPAAASKRPFQWNPFAEIKQNFTALKEQRPIFLSIVGLTYFSFLGGLFQLNILLYARQSMGVDQMISSLLLVVLALGIGLGAVWSGKVSDQKVELGLVPLGAMGISLFSITLGLVVHSLSAVVICLFILGLSCGFYIVPLNALIQHRSPADRRGQIIATNNFFSFFGILGGSLSLTFLRETLHLNPPQIFILCGILTVAGAAYVCKLLPYPLLRLVIWTMTHTLYRIRFISQGSIPKEGGALLAANHISLLDGFFMVVSTDRPIRFVMSREMFQWKPIHWMCRIARVIPILKTDNPKEIIKALLAAKEALKNGELVCIFPEGALTRTGNMLKFNKGIEHIVKGLDVPIIPIHLDRVWGSIFTFAGGKMLTQWPKIIPYPITVTIGQPMPASSTAFELRQKISQLGAEAFNYRLHDRMTLSESFFVESRRRPWCFCIADSSGRVMNKMLTFMVSLALAQKLKTVIKDHTCVGILLPPSVAGVLANVAVDILEKTPININYTVSHEALGQIASQSGMKICLTSKTFLEKTGIQMQVELIYIEDVLKDFKWNDYAKAFLTAFGLPRDIAHRLIFGSWANRSQDRLATIMFTSGSTGVPKGVMLKHSNVISNIEGLFQVLNIHPQDKMLGILPFFHSFGFTGTLWFPLLSGMGAVYHYNPLDAKMVGKLVLDHKVTIMMATPTFLSTYSRRCEYGQMASLRLVVVGAEKLKSTIANSFFEKFKVMPMEGYGCTELSPVVSVNLPDYEGEGIIQKAHKPGTIGLALPGVALRVVDPDTFVDRGVGENGLLLVKGPNVMKGYLNDPGKTAEVIVDGWYKTGDIANLDEDGFVTITDRLSRFSKIAGEMVPHIKIEEAIHQFLFATEQVCVVASIPDEKKGERLVVLCLNSVDVAVVCEGLKKSGLPNLWIPDAEMFFKVEVFPVLGTGKLDLAAVRRKVLELTQGTK